MGKKSKGVQETEKERALADVGRAQLADFQKRWLPVQQRFARNVVSANEPGSYERGRVATMAGVDTSVRFGQATDRLNQSAAQRGSFGSAGHRLGLTGMAEDRATSSGLGAVAADQSIDDQYVAGLSTVNALGRGEKSMALAGMNQAAALSARQASSDADRSLQNRMGNYQLAGTAIGIGAGLWGGGAGGGIGNTNDLSGVSGSNAYDQWLRYGRSGD